MNSLENNIHFYNKENQVILHWVKKEGKMSHRKVELTHYFMTTIKRNFFARFSQWIVSNDKPQSMGRNKV